MAGHEIRSSRMRICIHIISAIALATTLYSISVLDLEIVLCFHALHETRFVPSKIAYPSVDRRSSRESSHSASEIPVINNECHLPIFKTIQVQLFKYIRILLTAAQCTVVGACKK
jgi:hypothetical protein